MRDGSTHRRVTKLQPRPWKSPFVEARLWRDRHRLAALQALADHASTLRWTRRLLTVLLDELHVTDDFDRLVGPTTRVPVSQFPRLIAVAVLLRHSWSLPDLARTSTRLGLTCGALTTQLTAVSGERARRRRRASRAARLAPRPH